MKDKIILSNLAFFGTHGVFKEENVLGQKFFVDLDLYLETKAAGQSDDMLKSVHYGEVYNRVKHIVEEKEFNLLEALAEQLAEMLLNEFELLDAVMVRVKKPEAPIAGIFDFVAVEINRSRHA